MQPPRSYQPALSVVIPAFNESQRLIPTLEAIRRFAEHSPGPPVEVLVVDDGSSDNTPEVARAFAAAPLRLRVMVNEGNRGKGYSVRRGMLEATGEVLLMCDADLSTPIEEIGKLLPHLAAGAGVAIGSRAMPDSRLEPRQGPLRHTLDIAFRTVRRMVMLPDIRDTQCGFKAFTRPVALQVFREQASEGFAFDCEVLGLARAFGHTIREVGVVWRNDSRSTLRLWRDAPAMLWSLMKIRRRLNRLSRPPRQP